MFNYKEKERKEAGAGRERKEVPRCPRNQARARMGGEASFAEGCSQRGPAPRAGSAGWLRLEEPRGAHAIGYVQKEAGQREGLLLDPGKAQHQGLRRNHQTARFSRPPLFSPLVPLPCTLGNVTCARPELLQVGRTPANELSPVSGLEGRPASWSAWQGLSSAVEDRPRPRS